MLVPALAVAAAMAVDRLMVRRGLMPPGFAAGPGAGRERGAATRRALAIGVLAAIFWVGVFSPLAALGQERELDPEALHPLQLFLLHGLLVVALALWYGLAFAGGAPAGGWRRQLGLATRRPARELALGAVVGLVAWFGAVAALVAIGGALWYLGGEEWLPTEAPPLVPWIASLPLALRLGLSLSAGVVEEVFFRGFLQPRVGIVFSSGLFVLAHLSYEQPLMLVGIGLLSFVFALLVRWRQSVLAAIAAHTAFDAIQLGIVIPWALDLMDGEAPAWTFPAAAFGF